VSDYNKVLELKIVFFGFVLRIIEADNFFLLRSGMLLFEIRTFPTPPTLHLLFEPEQYFFSVLEIYCFRVGLCHLRLPIISCLNLDCVLCVNATENEEHLLFICPLYTDVRVKRLYDTHLNVVTVSLSKCSLGKSRCLQSD